VGELASTQRDGARRAGALASVPGSDLASQPTHRRHRRGHAGCVAKDERKTGMSNRYVQLGDGAVWPGLDLGDLEWQLRYGRLSREDSLVAASVVQAYQALITLPRRRRDQVCSLLRREMKGKLG